MIAAVVQVQMNVVPNRPLLAYEYSHNETLYTFKDELIYEITHLLHLECILLESIYGSM